MNSRFKTSYLVSVAATLALMSVAFAADDIAATGKKHVKTVLDRPLGDLNVMQPAVAAALQKAARAPYAPADPSCDMIVFEISQLDNALGPDFDTRGASKTKTLPTVSEIEGEAAGSFIPYEGALRFLTGADKRDRKAAEMILAGAVRRAFLKGTGEARGCALAAPIRVKATAN
ncbi:MAG TPA: hypothetical protein VFI23_10675 [Rhizomicrobium sp.]|nr:hypothetical protein [Rhizomicrobium sp.]